MSRARRASPRRTPHAPPPALPAADLVGLARVLARAVGLLTAAGDRALARDRDAEGDALRRALVAASADLDMLADALAHAAADTTTRTRGRTT